MKNKEKTQKQMNNSVLVSLKKHIWSENNQTSLA